MVESYECPICFDQFTDIKKPLMLPCGHTTCKICLKNLIKKNIIICPICQKEFLADLELFNVNYALLNNNYMPKPIQPQLNIGNLFELSTNLQKDIQTLEIFEKRLTDFHDESIEVNKKCKDEIIYAVDAIIASLQNIKAQFSKKIDDNMFQNSSFISKRKQEIKAQYDQRKKILAHFCDAQHFKKIPDANIIVEFNALSEIKSVEIKLAKCLFNNIINFNITPVSDTIIKNLEIKTEENILKPPERKIEKRKESDVYNIKYKTQLKAPNEIDSEIRISSPEGNRRNIIQNRGVSRRGRGGQGRYIQESPQY